MAVIVGALAPRDTIRDDNVFQLEDGWGVHSLSMGGQTFVYATGLTDDGISAFRLGADGSLENVQNIRDSQDTRYLLNNSASITSAEIDGTHFLYVCSADDNGITIFRVQPDGQLSFVDAVADDAQLQLSDSAGQMSVVRMGDRTFLIATGKDDNGISVFRIGADGRLTNTDNVLNTPANELNDAMDSAVIEVGGRTFVFVAGEDDNGVSGFELDANGDLTGTVDLDDLSNPALQLEGAATLDTATVGGTPLLIVAGLYDDGLSVFRVTGDGGLVNVFNLEDGGAVPLRRPHGVTTFTLGGETFAAVSVWEDGALSVYHVGSDGTLSEATTIFDDAALALMGSYYNAFAMSGGLPFLLATSFLENGLGSYEIGGGDDRLVGTGGRDVLLGLGGDDRLLGQGGLDRLLGGLGDDTYVLNGVLDTIEEHAGGGRDTVVVGRSYALGANLENLTLRGPDGLSGTGNALDNTIKGTGSDDRLFGREGDDRLLAGRAGDVVVGGRGDDLLRGNRGADELWGGRGRDRLSGGSGDDDFRFSKAGHSGADFATRDWILDFADGDRIVLKAVDADRGRAGDQAFALDLDGSFDAGEIRQVSVSRGLLLQLNTDADAAAEMSILLVGVRAALGGDDFVF